MTDDGWGRQEIIDRGIPIIESYGDVPITVRQLHYRLVSIGMPNTQQHYKRVVAAMTAARWSGDVEFDAFVDRERDMVGETLAEVKDLEDEIHRAQVQVEAWMTNHRLDRWSNQPMYVEVWIEKKALQGVFEKPCDDMDVALGPCKGYPSLTFLNEAQERFEMAEGRDQEVVILYFGDYDPSGVDIPRSIDENLSRMDNYYDYTVEVIALNPEQIRRWSLPPAPAKRTDSRARNWSGGVVELDAVEPRELQRLARNAIMEHFDPTLEEELREQEAREREVYQRRLLEHVKRIAEGS